MAENIFQKKQSLYFDLSNLHLWYYNQNKNNTQVTGTAYNQNADSTSSSCGLNTSAYRGFVLKMYSVRLCRQQSEYSITEGKTSIISECYWVFFWHTDFLPPYIFLKKLDFSTTETMTTKILSLFFWLPTF